jgi:lysophospholipid acyltransferase (LPLAT)-like uncharacterized protein
VTGRAHAAESLDAREEAVLRRARWLVPIGTWFLRLLAMTWRIRVVNPEAGSFGRREPRSRVFLLWHGELLPLLWQHRREKIAVLISSHRDGEIVARVAEALGFRTIRGSTSRGAARALMGLVRELEEGAEVAVTPDGPRGPAHVFAGGALVAAQRTGVPMVLIRAHAERAWRLRSWDRFLIPKPFARVSIAYADPVFVVADSARDAAADAARYEAGMDALGTTIGALNLARRTADAPA